MAQPFDDHRKRYLNLKSLKTLEACARHNSFAAVADELGVTQSAISKQMHKLEDDLGLVLFIPNAPTQKLTPAGQALAAHLSNVFFELENVIADLIAGAIDTPLIVSCEPTICLKLLIPSVPQIFADTGVEVRVLSGGGAIDFRRDHVDLAIRRNDFTIDENLYVQTLGAEYVGPVVAPHVANNAPENKVRIHSKTRPNAWLDWQEQTKKTAFRQDIHHQHHFLALEAAESGQGVALMSVHMVARSLQQGKLVAPYGFIADGSKYVSLSPSPIELDDRKVKFCRWFQDRLLKNLE